MRKHKGDRRMTVIALTPDLAQTSRISTRKPSTRHVRFVPRLATKPRCGTDVGIQRTADITEWSAGEWRPDGQSVLYGLYVVIEVLGPYQLLAVCRTKQGDYFELACSSVVDATERAETLAKSLGLRVASLEIPEEAKRVNCYGAEPLENQRRSPQSSTRRTSSNQVKP